MTARQNRFSETIGAPIHPDAPPILDADAVDGDKPLTWSTRLLFAGPATFDILGECLVARFQFVEEGEVLICSSSR